VLISDTELHGMASPPNLTALDKRIGQDTIAYMLDLRAKGGPIGRQFEQLYAARRGGDMLIILICSAVVVAGILWLFWLWNHGEL
jgi:hypothetical protein